LIRSFRRHPNAPSAQPTRRPTRGQARRTSPSDSCSSGGSSFPIAPRTSRHSSKLLSTPIRGSRPEPALGTRLRVANSH
jgi:hypothetical protein